MGTGKSTKQQTSTSQVSNVVTTTNIDDRDTFTQLVDDRDISTSYSSIDNSITETNLSDQSVDQVLTNAEGGIQLMHSAGAHVEVTDHGAIEAATHLASESVDAVHQIISDVLNKNSELTKDVIGELRSGAADYADFLASERAGFNEMIAAAQPDAENLKKMFQQILLAGVVLGGVMLWRRSS